MTITAASLAYYYNAATVDTTSANGGRIDLANRISSGVAEALIPHILEGDRTVGRTLYRKLFPLVYDDDDGTLLAPGLWLDKPTAADDWLYLFAGTQRDTQGDISSPRKYGAAMLKNDAAATDTSVVVTVEDASLVGVFADADTIRLTTNTGVLTAANTETRTVSGTPSVNGLDITLTLDSGLDNSYTVAAGGRVCSVYRPGDIAVSIDNVTATGLTYTADSLVGDNLGTIEQTWTLEASDASAFTVTGDTVGSITGGTIGADHIPLNPVNNKPYFTLPAGSITSMAATNTLVFQTHPAAAPIWICHQVPIGCSVFTDLATIRLRYYGEAGT